MSVTFAGKRVKRVAKAKSNGTEAPSRSDSEPVKCSALKCGKPATILHSESPLCGTHALERLEAESMPKIKTSANQPDAQGHDERDLGPRVLEDPRRFAQIDQKQVSADGCADSSEHTKPINHARHSADS